MLVVSVHAQALYQSRDVKQAYQKQTRSFDGRPGKRYWQNRANYNIDLLIAPPDRNVKGVETIEYVNNSPDTLHSIVMKLIINHHRPEATRYGTTGPDYLTEGISIDSLRINGKDGYWNSDMGTGTVQEIPLDAPLLPGSSAKIFVAWHYPLSRQSGREGMIDSTTFFLAYFYPRVAVYDDYNGWDRIEHNGGQEFYNDFNNYNLTVKVPSGYGVWATGDLLNPAEVLQPAVALKLERSMKTDEVIRIASAQDYAAGKVTRKDRINSWRFNASNITDIALAISNHYVWDATSAIVDNKTGRRASMQALYADSTTSFREMAKYGAHALNWYSHNWPGVPYPYSKMTAFQGYADMEYPMMINDSSIPGLEGRRVANHEIAHTWFPFYMGINETRYAFMDEAWATTLELLIAPSYMDQKKAEETYSLGRISRWVNNPAATADLPIITPSYELHEAYRTNAYGKPSLAYLALKDMLGDHDFGKCLHEYMNRWNGKHPLPWDFFFTFNDVSGKNLNWFWNNWFFSNNYIDVGIKSVIRSSKGYSVAINNKGGFAIPFDLKVNYASGRTKTIHVSPGEWAKNPAAVTIPVSGSEKITAVAINTGVFVDASSGDNVWRQ